MRFPVNYIEVKDFFIDNNNIVFGYCPEEPYVYSIDDGEVIYVQYQSKYNNVIFIKHNNGLVSMYKRLDDTFVKLGQKVSNGEKIGTIGFTIGSSKKFLLFGLFSESADYLNGESDLDLFDYLYIYSNQDVSISTINTFGVKLKYHESYWLDYKETELLNRDDIIVDSGENPSFSLSQNNLICFIFLIITFFFLMLFVVKKKVKRS